jgi:hypothetical protein
MKKLFLVVVVGASTVSFAQNNDATVKPKNNSLETPRFYVVLPKTPRLMVSSQFVATLPDGNKEYVLSQDNMPCIVPDLSHYNMPVIKPDITFTIPNPAMPKEGFSKPMILTEDQLGRMLQLMQRQPR